LARTSFDLPEGIWVHTIDLTQGIWPKRCGNVEGGREDEEGEDKERSEYNEDDEESHGEECNEGDHGDADGLVKG
jgi:hypothetical protein